MKKLNFILIFVLLSFMSCGNNELVNSDIVESMAAVNPVNTQMAEALSDYRDFITRDGFVKVSISYDFEIFRMTSEVKVEECFFDLFDCTETVTDKEVLGSETRSETYNSEVMVHRLGTTRITVLNGLNSILDRAVSGYNYGYGKFVVALENGETHYFDLNLPLSANPISAYNYVTNEGVALQNGGGWYTVQ